MDFKKFIIVFLSFNFLAFISCLSHNTPTNKELKNVKNPDKKTVQSNSKGLSFSQPKNNEVFAIGDLIEINLKRPSNNFEFDSVQLSVDNYNIAVQKKNNLEYILSQFMT